MRHEHPAQYGEGGPWHYASTGRDGGYPIGYCTRECTHATPEEAHEHYRQWCLDNLVEYQYADTMYRCAVTGCEEWTQWSYGPAGDHASHSMCDAHRDRDTYEFEFYPENGGIIEAWVS